MNDIIIFIHYVFLLLIVRYMYTKVKFVELEFNNRRET